MRRARNHRPRSGRHSMRGGVARLVVAALFGAWLVAALYGATMTVAALTLAIVLVEIADK